MFQEEIQLSEGTVWGDKTPEYLAIFEQLGTVFPQAKMIFLIRDGRDVVQSLADRGWQGWSIYQRSKYWLKGVLNIYRYAHQNPNKSLVIFYEDIVKDTRSNLSKMCEFIGVAYQPEMMNYHLEASKNITSIEKQNKIHTKLHRLPKTTDLHKWKSNQPSRKIFYTEAVLYPGLKRFGYQLSKFNPNNPLHHISRLVYISVDID